MGPLATPGEYTVTLTARQDGALTALTEPRSFTVRALEQGPETSADPAMVLAFQQRQLQSRRVLALLRHAGGARGPDQGLPQGRPGLSADRQGHHGKT